MTDNEKLAPANALGFIAHAAPTDLGNAYLEYFAQEFPDVAAKLMDKTGSENKPRTIGFAPIAISKGGSC